ncbi:MAG TPA: cytochrome c3 family protein [Syntrophales bacterium]|nr:cytochrome c3 family protein [Syntrophales bacterium]
MRYLSVVLILLGIGLAIAAVTVTGPVDSTCFGCHSNIYNEAISATYRHNVVLERCPVCHISSTGDLAAGDPHAPGFLDERSTTMTVCLGCHPFIRRSHPIGVRATKKGVRDPTDLPTIEGGIITCATCHEPHGSNSQFFSRGGFKRELCEKCHIVDMFSLNRSNQFDGTVFFAFAKYIF